MQAREPVECLKEVRFIWVRAVSYYLLGEICQRLVNNNFHTEQLNPVKAGEYNLWVAQVLRASVRKSSQMIDTVRPMRKLGQPSDFDGRTDNKK